MVNSTKIHSCQSGSDTTFKSDVFTFAIDIPNWPIKPADVLTPQLTHRKVFEELGTLHSELATSAEKRERETLFEWCECVMYVWSDGVCVVIENRTEHRTKEAIYAAYLIGREHLESAFEDAHSKYQASLAGGAA